MSSALGPQVDLVIAKGKTFNRVLQPGAKPFIYKAIASITQGAPARVVTSAVHGLPDGWPVAVVSVKGMRQINAEHDPPWLDEYKPATVIDTTTVDLNDVNSSDFSAYTSGGYLQFFTPTDLSGATARMTIKDKVGGTALITLSSPSTGIVLDNTAKTITITVDAATTAALTWSAGVYDAELELLDGTVVALMHGSVTVLDEVTT